MRWTIPGNSGAFPNISGVSARFNADNFNTTLNSGLGTWADTSGTGKHIAGSSITGTAITMGTSGSNANGATKSFNVVNGTSASHIQLLSAAQMTGKYTFSQSLVIAVRPKVAYSKLHQRPEAII